MIQPKYEIGQKVYAMNEYGPTIITIEGIKINKNWDDDNDDLSISYTAKNDYIQGSESDLFATKEELREHFNKLLEELG